MFAPLIGKTMEIYINMLVKSTIHRDHLAQFGETFMLMAQYKLQLNLEK